MSETFLRSGTMGSVRISIGILAYNEESAIEGTIGSISGQSIIKDLPTGWSVEIICVANGCRDKTAIVASEAINTLVDSVGDRRVSGRTEIVERASKENAWNEFVHRLSDRQSEFLIFMDGDIRLLDQDTLITLIQELQKHPRAYVCGARTVKSIELKQRQTILERISLAASDLRRHATEVAFAGCLYAARSQACRRLRLPLIMRGEDSFLRAIWCTDFFTVSVNQADSTRIISAPNARVMFEAYLSPSQVLKNLRRRAVGMTIHSMLYDRLWSESTPETDGGALLLRWHEQDPDWDQKLLRQKIKERENWIPGGGATFYQWASPRGDLWKWFRRMRGMPLVRKIKQFPVAAIATCLNLYAGIAAHRLIRSGKLDDLWLNPLAMNSRSRQ
jgi:glycosyltransferase involved in cell wall biosynthesis